VFDGVPNEGWWKQAQRERETAMDEEEAGAVDAPGEAERLTVIEEKLALLVRLREELAFEKRYAEVLLHSPL